MAGKQINVVAAVIEHDGLYLCAKRPIGKYAYTSNVWEFPGGKIEPNETEKEAIVRELKEEMNYDISVERHLVTVTHEYPDFTISLATYICHPVGDRDSFTLNEHTDYKWLRADELDSLEWAAADLGIVKAIKEE